MEIVATLVVHCQFATTVPFEAKLHEYVRPLGFVSQSAAGWNGVTMTFMLTV